MKGTSRGRNHTVGWAIRILKRAGFKRAAALLEKKHKPPAPKPVRKKRPPRQRVVYWARWGVKNTANIHYSEGPDRYDWAKQKPGHLPLSLDCSAFAALCYKWAGLPDPSGMNYAGGYTGTLLDNAQKHGRILTDITEALPGDLIVYGPGTGEHVAVIVKAGADPLTISHGDESGPELVYVSQDGRQPQRICRYL